MLAVRFGFAALHEITEMIDTIAAVVPAADVERTVLVAASQAAHVADLLRLEMLAQFLVDMILRAGHQAGAAVAHVGLHALVLPLQKIVETAGAVGVRLAHEEVITHFSERFHGR